MTVLSRSVAQRGAAKGLSTLSRAPARSARAIRRHPVAARAAQGEERFDFFGEFGILSLRLGTCVMMFHNG